MMQTCLFNPALPKHSGKTIVWSQLYGSSLGLAISNLVLQATGPIIIITADLLAAQRLESEILFFTSEKTPLEILNFPDWETLPYDTLSPHQDIISQRLKSLSRLPSLQKGLLILPFHTLIQRLPPREFIESHSFILAKGETVDIEQMRQRLAAYGYRNVTQVLEHGEFAVRGSLLDIFPMGSAIPYRIDLFSNEVDSIRTFDPESQRSTTTLEHIAVLPAREYPLTEQGISQFRQNWRIKFTGNPMLSPIYQNISQGVAAPGIEYYLPLFFQQSHSLFDYLPPTSLLVSPEDLPGLLQGFWSEIKERYEQYRHNLTRPLLAPEELYMPPNELNQAMQRFLQIKVANKIRHSTGETTYATSQPPSLLIEHKAKQPLAKLKDYIQENQKRILLVAESAGRREILLDLIKDIDVQPVIYASWHDFLIDNKPFGITIAPLEQGLVTDEFSLIVEAQLFGGEFIKRASKERTYDADTLIKNLAELSLGAPVVHIDHGVGRYLGLQTLTIGEQEAEYLCLEYADQAKLYVPVASLHLINRYSSNDSEHAPINRLGTDAWQKAKKKAAEKIRDVAAELLYIQAERASRKSFIYSVDKKEYQAFANAFLFEETADQAKAIQAVIDDLTSHKSMDRLICGDVGFGKTEVAMRAAFIVAQAGRQVALLVPTTLLAEQHYQNFKDRFADWPIRIEVISRFRTSHEQSKIIVDLKLGKIDIIIGTHKLLQKHIQFKDLGLVILDEEHRFGVTQKERLKALRAEVDILTLTATPIPRTLNMALSGIRDLSIIATPPAKRLSIKTFVYEYDKQVIREAILREIMRGGQVYYLHNKVQTIDKIARELMTLVPEARLAIAHGQMRERELENVMVDFYHQRFHVLICSTIIETGLDIPSANTIIIERADKFGLAQLHQLRGRVGRSHHQAYAYLLIPSRESISSDACKRLDAISAFEDLGAGFTLATQDLEIRGAGELLGEEQSGHMHSIGFTLYMELLENAVQALKSGQAFNIDTPFSSSVEIELKIPALIPEDYLPDVHMRLILYKRIAHAKDIHALNEIQVEMIDRFGLLPNQTKNLFKVTELKLAAQSLGIRKIECHAQGGKLEFTEQPKIDPNAIIRLIQQQPGIYRLDGPHGLRFKLEQTEPAQRLTNLERLLYLLNQK